MHTIASLTADLEALNIRRTDTLLIHSSMKSIGEVEGGADTVLDALMAYFKDDGLLVFPTLTYRVVNGDSPRFDVRSTPVSTGILPELFRQRPGVVRSLHPTHSVAAFGKDAAAFAAGHEKADSPAPVGSPWWKLLQRKGKILFIGTGIGCNTFLHGLDEWLQLPGMRRDDVEQLEIVDYQCNLIPSPQHRHCVGRNAYYASLEQDFDNAGALTRGRFGSAECHLLDCEKISALLGYRIPLPR